MAVKGWRVGCFLLFGHDCVCWVGLELLCRLAKLYLLWFLITLAIGKFQLFLEIRNGIILAALFLLPNSLFCLALVLI